MVERKCLILKVKKRQFADHLQVSISTINAWMKKNVLVEGRHYIKIKNIVRFYLDDDLLKELHQTRNKQQKNHSVGVLKEIKKIDLNR
jgi:hypothetical protein